MSRKNEVYHYLQKTKRSVTAQEAGDALDLNRSTMSRYLNELVKDNRATKVAGKPVKYMVNSPELDTNVHSQEERAQSYEFQPGITNESLSKKTVQSSQDARADKATEGIGQSLLPIIDQGLAAFMYPSQSLPILLTGETGTGKTFFAEMLSKIAKQKLAKEADLPFVVFNCADYAQNEELLVGQIFGIKKGAFTGADADQPGLVEEADNGVLFLDEIHRLPSSGQEMLFYLMDEGVYHRLGEATTTRRANVMLIGATTEEPNQVMLPTLLRRFSVKLNLPPLRERSRDERAQFIDHFLREEAQKMGARLSIMDNSREAFLAYPSPGNIGQLKSDIQIACAHAYLRYLNHESDHVSIQASDLPDPVNRYVSKGTSANAGMAIVNRSQQSNTELSNLPNIYQQLATQGDQKELQSTIEQYIQALARKYHYTDVPEDSWQHLIDEDLLQTLSKAVPMLKESLPDELDADQIYVIGLHLQNYRNHEDHRRPKDLPVVWHYNTRYRQAAHQLADYLQKEIGMELPEEEIELLPHFLTENHTSEITSPQNVSVIVVTHGDSTATSMANVTNKLLGTDVIKAVDMPLTFSAQEIYERVKQKINHLHADEGTLLLVDMGSLITMGDTIQHELDVPIKVLSSVNLPMVLEAGSKALMPELSLEQVYQAAQKGMTLFVKEEPAASDKKSVDKKRMIVTVCFTGEGAAQLLESWLDNQLSYYDQDVLIRTVRIDPNTHDTSILDDLTIYYDVIAIIGTVPVSMKSVPYIPAWELLRQDGISRLTKLMEITRKNFHQVDESKSITEDELPSLVQEGLGEIVTYVNPKSVTSLLSRYMTDIRNFYNWNIDRELGMWMHMGALVDRLIASHLQAEDSLNIAPLPANGTSTMTRQENEIWAPLLDDLEQTYHFTITEEIKQELIKLSR